MLIGATSEGCCLLDFHDRKGLPNLIKEIKKRYNGEFIDGTNAHIESLEKELDLYFEGKLEDFTTKLDIRGTPFQMKVWTQLLDIPYGKTLSYGQVAKLINQPLSSRAVGKANGSNHLAIIIPCHRVIRGDGHLQGYGGGLWRKEKLLSIENR